MKNHSGRNRSIRPTFSPVFASGNLDLRKKRLHGNATKSLNRGFLLKF